MKSPFFSLTSSVPYLAIDIQFEAATLVVENKTGSAVFIRVGAQDQPTAANADIVVPAGMSQSYPVNGYNFAAAFDNPAAISTAVAAKSGLFQTCKIQLLDGQEMSPSYGTASFLSLSISELQPIAPISGPGYGGVFDIGAWGGALIYLNPSSASGQGICFVDVSEDAVNYYPLITVAFWPNIPSVLTIPRVAKFFRVGFNVLAGDPAISLTWSVRATLQEIQQISYNPGQGNAIVKSFNIVGLSQQQFVFLTAGLPAVSLAAIATAGTTGNAAMDLLVEASSDNVNWRRVTIREQLMSSGLTLYRALGNLDTLIRVTVYQITSGQTLIGNLYASIPREADLGYILNTIQQSLGDIGAPVNVRQDIYHELESIYQVENANLPGITTGLTQIHNDIASGTNVQLGGIQTTLNNIYSVDNTQLPAIATNTAHLAAIDTGVAQIHTDIASGTNVQLSNMQTTLNNIYSLENLQLPAIATNTTQIPNIKTDTSNLPGMKTDLDNVNAALTRTVASVVNSTAVVGGNYTNLGSVFTPGQWITAAQAAISGMAAGTNGTDLLMGVGTNGGVTFTFYRACPSANGGANCAAQGPCMIFGSIRSPGYQIPAGQTNLWVYSTVGGTFMPTIAVSP